MIHTERRQYAEKRIKPYIKPIYGFSLKRTVNLQDAEDLSQEIVLKLYKVLLVKDDIEDLDRYVWQVAHNVSANYFRSKSRQSFLVDIDEFADHLISDGDSPDDILTNKDTLQQLRSEIAYLSKMQRQVLIHYYYDGMTQEQISSLYPKGHRKMAPVRSQKRTDERDGNDA